MYHHFTGILTELNLNSAVIECCGIGYILSISSTSHVQIAPKVGECITLLSHFSVREDNQELYGFATREERDAFRLLITVSGVGPKAAIAILSVLTPQNLGTAVSNSDARSIAMAQGVGQKTAARVILEQHDKFSYIPNNTKNSKEVTQIIKSNASIGDALEGLITLGYTRAEATNAIKSIKTENKDTADIIRDALSLLLKK